MQDPAIIIAQQREEILGLRRRLAELEAGRERTTQLERDHAADQAQRRFDFLAEASRTLGSSLDYETTLQSVARIAVPQIADWCSIDLVDEQGEPRRLAVAHVDPAKVEWAYELQRRYPPDPNSETGVHKVLRTGEPVFFREIDDAMLVAAARDDRHLELMSADGFTSAIIVPLVGRESTLGAITLVSAESQRRYGADDLALAQIFAQRAAQVIDNARLYREAQEQREWLGITLASIGDAVTATDKRGHVIFMNQVAETLTGWPREQAEGRTLQEVFEIADEQTRQPIENPAARVQREGIVVGLANHTILIGRDGSERPIDDSGAPIRNDQGELIGVVIVFRDISARRYAELALRASERRYHTLVEALPQITWTLTSDGALDYLNRRWVEYTGLPMDVRHNSGWLDAIHHEDRAALLATRANAIAAGEPYEQSIRMRRADGMYRWHLARVTPLNHGEQILAWIGTATDIHDLKQAEEAQRFLAEASRALSASLDYEDTLAQVTRLAVPQIADWCAINVITEEGAIQLLAVAHIDQAAEQELRDLSVRYPLDPSAEAGVPKVLRTGQPEFYPEVDDTFWLLGAADDEHARRLRSFPTKSYICVPLVARRQRLGAITLASIGADRRYGPADLALAQELAGRAAIAIDNARLYRETQDAVRLRDQFLSIASHELKTPLTSLSGNAQLLQRRARREGGFQERELRSIEVIVDQAARLNKLIAALLDISRIETGHLSIERQPLDVGALARRVVAEIQPALDRHSV
jgi:PAS domain S-box-containing protein